MAHSRSEAFRKNRQLQQFVLTDVTPTGVTLGVGSFGTVLQVCNYLKCNTVANKSSFCCRYSTSIMLMLARRFMMFS